MLTYLAFWTGKDAERMERMFEQTELANRGKWNRADYRERTIAKAIADTAETYSGNGRGPDSTTEPEFPERTLADADAPPARTASGEPVPDEPTPAAETKKPRTRRPRAKSAQILAALEGLGLNLRLNELEDTVEANGARFDDIMLSDINLRMVDQGHSRPDVADAINVLANRGRYHPIRDYLNGLTWDGADHIGDMLACLHCAGPTVDRDGIRRPIGHVLITRWLLGCVARAMDGAIPGAVRFQTPMLVLSGAQDIGKSWWVRWLASGVGAEYYRESMLNPHSIEDQRSMVTKWIWEVTELAGSLRRADRDATKAFITQEYHTYRKPWGRYAITKPTLCNLVGTINPETGFLDDPTGNRRFWPVDVQGIDHSYAQEVPVNQLWAQVRHLYITGGLAPGLQADEQKALARMHEAHAVENPLESYMKMYFDVDPADGERRCHTASIIDRLKAFGVALPADQRVAGRVINDVLAPMGLKRGQFRMAGVSTTGWIGISMNARPEPERMWGRGG